MMREERIGPHRLFLGDCMEIVQSIGPVSAVLTDPPYGIDYKSGHATDDLWKGGRSIRNDLDTRARDEFLTMWASTQGTPALVFGSRKVVEPNCCRMILIWDKGPALGMGALDIPWKPSSEEIYVIGRGFVGSRDESNVIYCPPVQSMAKNGRLHPNEKPVALLARLLRKLPEGVVLDPFMGSGSTIEAAHKMGRAGIGIEIDPNYFDIACRRIEAIEKQGCLFPAPASEDQPHD